MVWLLQCNITTTRPCSKLDYTILGPFRINPVAYRLDLPPHYRIHDVFHVSLLEVYHPSVLPGWQPARPPPIELVFGDEYEVQEILNSQILRWKLYYLVRWKGYPISGATWEHHLTHATEVVCAFHSSLRRLEVGAKLGDNVKDMTMVMSRFELMTSCVITNRFNIQSCA